VHGFDSRLGAYNFTVTESSPPAPILNGDCSTAVEVFADGTSILGILRDDTGAGEVLREESGVSCASGTTDSVPTVWYKLIGTGNILTVSTCHSSTTSSIASLLVLVGDCETTTTTATTTGQSLACVGPTVAAQCGDHGMSLTWQSDAGLEYYIVVVVRPPSLAEREDSGNFVLTVEETAPNDDCEGALGPLNALDGSLTFGSTRSSRVVSNMEITTTTGLCGDDDGATTTNTSSNSRGTWYSLWGTGEEHTVSTCNRFTNFDTQIFVFSGDDCSSLTCVGTSSSSSSTDSSNSSTCSSTISWLASKAEFYRILVTGKDRNQYGTFGLEIGSTTTILVI
jgi:hypothetical protein